MHLCEKLNKRAVGGPCICVPFNVRAVRLKFAVIVALSRFQTMIGDLDMEICGSTFPPRGVRVDMFESSITLRIPSEMGRKQIQLQLIAKENRYRSTMWI